MPRSKPYPILLTLSIVLLSVFLYNWQIRILAEPTPRIEGKPGGTLPGGSRLRLPNSWEIQPAALPEVGVPARRVSRTTRPSVTCFSGQKPLVALMPEGGSGGTVAAYPQFSFYVPQTTAIEVEFVLEDENRNAIYTSRFQISGEPGIISLSLPNWVNLPPLEIGKNYYWLFSAICDPQDRSEDVVVQGLVQRIQLDPILIQQLEQATPIERANLYAENRLWYDTLATLAELRRANSNDSELVADWASLLQSVGLAELAEEPLVGTPPSP